MPPSLTLTERRKLWLETLRGDDTNSVMNQLTEMTWYFAAFKVVNEARRIAAPARSGGVQLNGLMHDLITHGFYVMQSAAVRRLLDKKDADDRKKGVFSLMGLLLDIVKHAELLTRRNLLEAESLVYDFEPLRDADRQRDIEELLADGKIRARSCPNTGNWHGSEHRHEMIDRLARVAAADRKPTDAIPLSLLQSLKTKVEIACSAISVFATKYIAHAAIPSSRAAENTTNPKLIELEVGLRSLCEVASFIAIHILGDSSAPPLPFPTYDVLEYVERPLVTSAQIETLRTVWDGFAKESETWNNWQPTDVRETVEEQRYRAYESAAVQVASKVYGRPLTDVSLQPSQVHELVDETEGSDQLDNTEASIRVAGKVAAYFADRNRGPAKSDNAPEDRAKENSFAVTIAEMFAHSLNADGIDHRSVVEIVVSRWEIIDSLAKKFLSCREMTASEVATELASVVA